MRPTAGACLVAAAVLLAGCGGGSGNDLVSESAGQILQAAQNAAMHASAMEIAGTIAMGGQPVALDLTIVGRAKAKGTVGLGGKGVHLIRIGDHVYINGSKAYYTKFANPEAATLLAGKWISGTADQPGFSDLAKATQILIVPSLFKRLSHHGRLTKGAVTTIGGAKAIAIVDHSSDGGTLFVALTGKPYPLELESPNGGKRGKVTFMHWDEIVPVTAPKGAIDLSKISGA